MSISLPAEAINRFDLIYKKAASLGLDCGKFGCKLPLNSAHRGIEFSMILSNQMETD